MGSRFYSNICTRLSNINDLPCTGSDIRQSGLGHATVSGLDITHPGLGHAMLSDSDISLWIWVMPGCQVQTSVPLV